jgi:SAM-dependent methyltransferase
VNSQEAAALWESNAATWTQLVRKGCDYYRDALNTPAMLAMLPPVAGLVGLDIGCGEGCNTRKLAALGARMAAVDVAPTFIHFAREAESSEPLGIEYQVANAMEMPFAEGCFDFATAFMSLMDMPNQARALGEAYRVLKPGGFLQFSILHPCFAPPYRKVLREPDGNVRAIEVAGYFDNVDGRIETWCFSSLPEEEAAKLPPFRVPRFHRTLSQWVGMICVAGFVIQKFGEPSASIEVAATHPGLADTRVAGLFLHVRCVKPKVLEF